MKGLFKLPMLVVLVVAVLIAAGLVARVTGLWPAGEATHARPHQRVP